jgi:glycosyltransferase involved in cell wall biosynthesis
MDKQAPNDPLQVRFPRVLVVAQSTPWPPRGGGDLRTAGTLSALASAGVQVGLATFAPLRDAAAAPREIQLWAPPATDSRAEDPAAAFGWIREHDGHPSDLWWTPAARTALASALDSLDPQLVILEHLWTHRALELTGARATILSSQNVEGPLHEAMAEAPDLQAPVALARLMARRTVALEAATVSRVDQVWACSSADADGFRARYPGCAPVEVIPNALALPELRQAPPPRSAPLVLFVGSFGYPPNAAAALWLGQVLLPALRDAGLAASLRLIGADPPETVRRLADDPAIEVLGFVEDLRPHLEAASLTAVPLFTGGGTRFKVLEAFATGIPVVSTAKGVEGIDAVAGTHYLGAEDVTAFTAAITELWQSPELRERLTANARALAEERYAAATLYERVASALERLAPR